MSTSPLSPTTRVDLQRRDTEIAVAVFRTIFLLLVVLSPQFRYARGIQGDLLIVVTVAAAVYNVVLFILHMQKLPFPRALIVGIDLVLVTLWLYFSGPYGERFSVMYFAVVIIAGLWFRRGGTLAVGVLASLLYIWAVAVAPVPVGTTRVAEGAMVVQVIFLLLTAGVVSVATEVQARERQELMLSRAALKQHWQRIQIAQHVDSMIRPRRLPTTPGLSVAFRFRPAAQAVSGDLYDVIQLGGRRWGIVIADVRAKEELGLYYLPLFRSSLRLAAKRENSPASVLAHMNRDVWSDMHDRDEVEAFISMVYVVVDLDAGELVYANAGNEPGVLVTRRGGDTTSLEAHGLVLGVLPDAAYTEERQALETGDAIVLFTDGLTEAFDGEGKLLGRDALLETISEHARDASADSMAQQVFGRVLDYSSDGQRRDDMTLLVARVTTADLGAGAEPNAV
ncbi:MAG: serine/threonine-protein phosphatase [Armatimonadetes bacterium]|nr:serine/threonine-protein phosphatase [Armatimonadota bacterium]